MPIHPSPITVQRLDAATLRVTRPSPLTGRVSTMTLMITEDQWERFLGRQGLIQDIFPSLSRSQCEFLQTGYTDADWAAMFPPKPEEDEE